MRLAPGTVAYFREAFDGGLDKFIYILGVLDPPGADGGRQVQEVLWFTISSQAKWTAITPHCDEMVKIPLGTAECLKRLSFIQCFHEVQRKPLVEFRELENRGYVTYRDFLPMFVPTILAIMQQSHLLTDYERDDVKAVLTRRAEAAVSAGQSRPLSTRTSPEHPSPGRPSRPEDER
jgi:hypothetical protein